MDTSPSGSAPGAHPGPADRHPLADFVEGIPGNRLLGLEVVRMDDSGATIRLPWRDEIGNHIGTVHAAALLGLADAASGAAMGAVGGSHLGRAIPVVQHAEIDYLAPGRTDLNGTCDVDSTALDSAIEEVERNGSASFVVEVLVTDTDEELVARAHMRWHLRAPRDESRA